MEHVGFVIASLLFFFAGFNHFKNHDTMVGYASSSGMPVAYVAGWPTGAFLLATAVLVAFGYVAGFVMAFGFLLLSGFFFHRNLKDPANQKHYALAGLFLALAFLV